jgi:Phycobilisome protein
MITLLETLLEGAEGSYVNTQDFRNLEHVMSSWGERKEAYLAVQSKEKSIIDRALTLMQDDQAFSDNPPIDDIKIELCRRDITLALRYYALGMLLQDEEMLKDRFKRWACITTKASNLSLNLFVPNCLRSKQIYLSLTSSSAKT